MDQEVLENQSIVNIIFVFGLVLNIRRKIQKIEGFEVQVLLELVKIIFWVYSDSGRLGSQLRLWWYFVREKNFSIHDL